MHTLDYARPGRRSCGRGRAPSEEARQHERVGRPRCRTEPSEAEQQQPYKPTPFVARAKKQAGAALVGTGRPPPTGLGACKGGEGAVGWHEG